MISTQRLLLVCGNAQDGKERFELQMSYSKNLSGFIPSGWPESWMRLGLASLREEMLSSSLNWAPWGGWYVLMPSKRGLDLVGANGFKGPPDGAGAVEIGYSVLPSFEGLGIATEATHQLINWALAQPQVKSVKAVTSQENRASQRVLEKCGMRCEGTSQDLRRLLHWSIFRSP